MVAADHPDRRGPGGGPQAAQFNGGTFQTVSSFFAFPGFSGGLFIAG